MQVDRRIDMHSIHIGILEQRLEIFIPLAYFILTAYLFKLLFRTLADRVHIRIGMILINRNKFLAKSESYDGDVNLLSTHSFYSSKLSLFGEREVHFAADLHFLLLGAEPLVPGFEYVRAGRQTLNGE